MQFALCFSLGVMLAALVERLLPINHIFLFFVLLAVATATCCVLLSQNTLVRRLLLLPLVTLAGFGYGSYSNQLALAKQLPDELDRQIFWVSGVVRDIVIDTPLRKRFVFQVGHETTGNIPAEGSLLLNWYDPDRHVKVGSFWQLKVRLKAPRGFVNPAGFDYQGWLLRKGFSATGTVKDASAIELAEESGFTVSATLVDYARDDLRRWLGSQDVQHKGLLKALLIGDKNDIASSEWLLMRHTGTAHLMAISGLHIGLIAMLGYAFGSLLGRGINCLYLPQASTSVAHFCAALAAVGYAALAGFTTPTLRALVMVLAVQLCLVLYRVAHKRLMFSLALLVIAVVDPLAVWEAGFWLSFLAALVLILIFSGRCQLPPKGLARLFEGGRQALRSQWYLFFGLLIPLLMFMQRATFLAPMANIVAIPTVSVLVVPLLALSVLARVLPGTWGELLSGSLVQCADYALSVLWQGLELMNTWLSVNHIALGASAVGVWLSLGLAVVLLMLPRGVPGRMLSYPVLLLPFVFPSYKSPSEAVITFMDVGQGTAVVINVGDRWLVYDTGRRFSEKFDAGSGIISPYLDANGVRAIDRLIISHGDADHSGGAAALSKNHRVQETFAPRELINCLSSGASNCLPQSWHSKPLPERIKSRRFTSCELPNQWRWGATQFSLFSARTQVSGEASAGRGHNPKSHQRNNRSCLLLVEHRGVSVLLTGDVEAIAERSLIAANLLPKSVDWMSAPHHGSKTSSSELLLGYLNPANVVFQYGHNNSYHHPNKEVVRRYRALGANLEMTDESGAVQLIIDEQGRQKVIRWRSEHRRFWY